MLTITATDLQRFMACNGSRLIEGFKPSITTFDSDKEEGNAAHWLIKELYQSKFQAEELIDRKAYNGFFITAEMTENIEEFMNADPNRVGLVEIETSFGGANWQINARADRIIDQPGLLYVDDFKYGWGIIEPENNWTLIAHALGYCIAKKITPSIITFRIFQPRPYHPDGKVRSWSIDYNTLLKFYNEINSVLSNPSDMLHTGSHCKNCPKYVYCPANKKMQMNMLDVAEMAFTDKVDNEFLSNHLDVLNYAIKTLETAYKAYSELALHRVKLGEHVSNYSIQNELTSLQWLDFVTPELIEIATGRTDLVKKKLITPTQAKKLNVSEDFVHSMADRANKGVKLVRIDENKKAQKAFGKKEGN